MLLSANAAVDRAHECGPTPLVAAADQHYEEVVQLLLESHADPTAWQYPEPEV